MTKFKSAATTVSLLAELSHIFCCGLPIFVAVLSAGSQIGVGGLAAFHGVMHDYERLILAGSGALLTLGLVLHYISYQIDCRTIACGDAHGDCAPKKFRVGWIFSVAVVLYAANLAFYFLSGHGAEPHRFSSLTATFI
jgi:hypothetical protein